MRTSIGAGPMAAQPTLFERETQTSRSSQEGFDLNCLSFSLELHRQLWNTFVDERAWGRDLPVRKSYGLAIKSEKYTDESLLLNYRLEETQCCSCIATSSQAFSMAIIQECNTRAQTERTISHCDPLRERFVVCLMAKIELQRRLLWASDLLAAHPEDCVAFCSGCAQFGEAIGSDHGSK